MLAPHRCRSSAAAACLVTACHADRTEAVTFRPAGREREDRVETIEGLNGRLLIDAEHGGMDDGVLLGRVIAHELGHLLLGTSDHSARGLMRANWSDREIESGLGSDWLLTPKDAARMRQRMLARPEQADASKAVGAASADVTAPEAP